MKALANRAVEEFGGEELVDLMADSGLGADPRFIELFITIGNRMAEDSELLGRGGEEGISPDDIRNRINELMARPGYLDTSSPDHKGLIKQVMSLRERLHELRGK